MAITLAEAKKGMVNKIDLNLIDEFRRNSLLLDLLTFDDAVAPSTNGSTLTYGYVRLSTPSYAEGRAINSEYSGSEAKKTEEFVTLKILGGKYSIDRVLAQTGGTKFTDEVAFQTEQKVKATTNRFQYLFVKGNKSSDSKQFDGLDVITTANLTFNGAYINGYASAMTATNAEAICEALDEAISKMQRKPDVILANSKTILKLKAAARMSGYYTRSEDAFGKTVDGYNNIPFIDLQEYYASGGKTEIIGDGVIYFACLGLDGVHGVSPTSTSAFISTRLPDFSTAGAVKDGDVEMVTAIAVKDTRAAYKLTLTGTSAYSITATLSHANAASGNASTIVAGSWTKLVYTAADGYTLPTSVSVSGASSSWDKANGILTIWNPTGNVTFTITATS